MTSLPLDQIRCTVCGQHRDHWGHPADHPFVRPGAAVGPPDTWAETREMLKAARGKPIETARRKTLDEMTSGPRVQALKAEMAAAQVAAAAAIAEPEEPT